MSIIGLIPPGLERRSLIVNTKKLMRFVIMIHTQTGQISPLI